MSTRDEFWSVVDEQFDARRDPLANEHVRAWLLEHPEDALELADLRASLRTIESADNPLRAPRRSRLVPIAAAAGVLALAALGARLAFPARTALEELELHPVVAAPELGCVQSWEIVSTSETVSGTQTVHASEGRLAHEYDFNAAGSDLAQASVVASHEESWFPQ
jgi:hypothetical protein